MQCFTLQDLFSFVCCFCPASKPSPTKLDLDSFLSLCFLHVTFIRQLASLLFGIFMASFVPVCTEVGGVVHLEVGSCKPGSTVQLWYSFWIQILLRFVLAHMFKNHHYFV